MQVARLLEPRPQRSFDAKLRQTVRALELEWALSKDEILGLYLTLAPYGGNLEGVRARLARLFRQGAARVSRWARRRCSWPCRSRRNTAGRTAFPKRPSARATACSTAWRHPVDGHGLFSAAEIAHAKKEKVPTSRKPMPLIAPHAADQAVMRSPKERR